MRPRKLLMLLKRVSRNLVARILLGALVAFVTALVAPLFEGLIPKDLQDRFGSDAVMPILSILASTMLTVTTFSLSVMVQAFQTAANSATPRAYRLHLNDTTTQTVLATFTGAFLFSLTAIVMFRAGFYSESAAVVIFGVTVVVIALIILAIIRWIDHLSSLGSMDDTLSKVEAQARETLARIFERPALGGVPLAAGAEMPSGTVPVRAPRGGYVQLIDMAALNDMLGDASAHIVLATSPGRHVVKGAVIGHVLGDANPEQLANAFTFGEIRTAEQDARFGVIVLNEIAVRALSPGINDPGTAIDVIHRLSRVLSDLRHPGNPPPEFPRIEVPVLHPADLIEDGFASLIRAGREHPEVIGLAVEALGQLEGSDWPEMANEAKSMRGYALRHAKEVLSLRDDRDAVARS
ncbi:hypothetical protein GCM10011415_31600 [Salipiger pallidus]|uniref:DUF2254 domain-containing protein n=1 Tax=Salipiger pallidus TaxID=1775170 RepID=A0A8J2ZLM5_9RHOB|nr:DUF2254 domain-containing protein [Salipiger pallidus]GGG79971.1 hypothetical protein GCM10011415_31600 [Salipiger pallidus]